MEISAIPANYPAQTVSHPPARTVENPDHEVVSREDKIPPGQMKQKKIPGQNGVLRLLQEGHFKPNAEMQLRANHHQGLLMISQAHAGNNNQPQDIEAADTAPDI